MEDTMGKWSGGSREKGDSGLENKGLGRIGQEGKNQENEGGKQKILHKNQEGIGENREYITGRQESIGKSEENINEGQKSTGRSRVSEPIIRKLGARKHRFTAWLLAAGILCSVLSSCTATKPVAETVQAPSYEQYSKRELQAQEQEIRDSFDEFMETLFRESVQQDTLSLHYYMMDPSAFGITDYPVTLGTYSSQDIRDSLEENEKLLRQLQTDYDYEVLTKEQQLTMDILVAMLECNIACEEYPLYYEYLSPNLGVQAELPILLAEYQFYSKRDVEDYLELLGQLPDCFQQLVDFENEKSAAGLFMCDEVADQVIESCQQIISDSDDHFLNQVFAEKLGQLEGVTEEEKSAWTEKNREMMENAFFPAYQLLIDGFTALKGSGANSGGLAGYSNGKKYYEALIQQTTGTKRSVADIKKLLLNRLNEDLSAINDMLKDNENLYSQAADFSFSLTEPEEILEDLKVKIAEDFPELETETHYTVKSIQPALEDVMSPALYMVSPIDRITENTIYINEKYYSDRSTLYATLAHEGYPGHLYQEVFSSTAMPCNMRRLVSVPGYSEGWGIYSEYYAYSLDTQADQVLADIRAHNFSASMAIYALLDIYVNYDNWDKEQTAQFLKECYGIESGSATDAAFYMVVSEPGYYVKYYVGYLEFCELRKTAEEKLGAKFVPKEFHRFLLEIGDCPFWVLEKYMEPWIEEQSGQ